VAFVVGIVVGEAAAVDIVVAVVDLGSKAELMEEEEHHHHRLILVRRTAHLIRHRSLRKQMLVAVMDILLAVVDILLVVVDILLVVAVDIRFLLAVVAEDIVEEIHYPLVVADNLLLAVVVDIVA
jgi:hypothetical protein